MSFVKHKLAFLTKSEKISHTFSEFEPLLLNEKQIASTNYNVDILVMDNSFLNSSEFVQALALKKNQFEFQKIVLILNDNQLTLENYNLIKPDVVIQQKDLQTDLFHELWEQISQTEQDDSYLNLSSELNSQYELIKLELEKKLDEKTKNLIESRKQIFEINNRFEFLRKTLYVTSEVKSLQEAETELNALLTQQNKLTWLKIIEGTQTQKFEADLGPEFDSSFFKTEIVINSESQWIYFFKGDKKLFKKPDLEYFKKLAETLQINLSRYANLLSLQQSERLFDLAFHSSPHYILVLDQDYQVLQANLAIEKIIKNSDQSKCYELLFNRKSPCTGCHLGEKFQIQNNLETFRVQSNPFNLNEDEDKHYWIHLYENISEQKALENKFQQTARLAELGLISSSIAHELNNPLGGIISYLQIMKMELPQNHPFQTDIEMLNQTSLRMKKIIEELLIFSRKEDSLQIENLSVYDVLTKNIDLLQMQLKKENLKISIKEPAELISHPISALHFRHSIHLVFQYFLQKLKVKKLNQNNYTGLVEVKIFQDQMNSYLSFAANLGPYDPLVNSNDMTLMTLEKSLLDQAFQIVTSESQPGWIQILITLPKTKA